MFHVQLDSAFPFKALSYAWGSPDDPHYPIELNGAGFQVRENLWLTLQHLRSQIGPAVTWIDAICIDQINDTERNEQVARMKTIYERADDVVVWLGPSYADSEIAFQFVRELYDHRDSVDEINRIIKHPRAKESLVSLVNLFQRDYWWRIWIVQELTVAKHFTLHCGADTLPVEFFG